MISDYRCFFCFARAFEELLESKNLSADFKNLFTKEMAGLYCNCWENFSAPEFSRKLYEILSKYTNDSDPYYLAKRNSNDLILNQYDLFRERVLDSSNPFDTALRLAIAGNIIDMGKGEIFDLEGTIEKIFSCNFAIDNSEELKYSISKAKTVLYLGDNAGEIVFDKLFIEQLSHPNLIFAVRGAPALNDATIEDAEYVGMNKAVKVISNGYNAASTILEHCSEEFMEIYNRADLIISKGQGNLEGLFGKVNKEIYYLLIVKCDVIADLLKVKNGDFIVKRVKQ